MDSVSARPGRDMDVLQENLFKGLYEVFEKNPLKRFVELNGLEPVGDLAPPEFHGDERYDIELVLKPLYAYC